MTSKKIKIILIFFLSIFSFFINKHYANLGMEPMDTFVLYNGGYKVLNGLIPFKDYWLTTGPLMDYINALFFSIGGVNWNTYIILSSLFNVMITISTYLFLNILGLNKYYSFFFSLMFATLMYPVVGSPFVDHHSTIFVLLSFYFFIIGISQENSKFFFYIPSILILAFLCKQTPAAYGIMIIFFLGILYLSCYQNKKEIFLNSLYGSILGILILLTFLLLTKIPIKNFYIQYIAYGGSIGSYRLKHMEPDILGIIHQYKFILLPLLFSILIFFKAKLIKNKKEILIFSSFIFLTLILLFHQLLTLNENFIFFLIPILTGINHIYLQKFFPKKNFIRFFLIIICMLSVFKYHDRFNEKRKFHTLEYINLNLAVDAKIIDESLEGLKWITKKYADKPTIEINGIKETLEILSNEKEKYMLITNYLFISPILKTNDFSPNQWHHPNVSFPIRGNKDFFIYKKFFTDKLIINDILNIYTVGDDLKNILSLLYKKECFIKTKVGYFTYKYLIIKSCRDLYEFS